MGILNNAAGAVVAGLLAPFAGKPILGLVAVSLLAAAGLLLVVRLTSNQARVVAVKRQLQADIYEVRLFKDDARVMWRAVGGMVWHNIRYLALSLVPVVWAAVPLALLVVQLQHFFGYDEFSPGRPFVVTVRVADASGRPDISLVAPPGLRVETPGVWIPSLSEMAWRLAADRSGDYELAVRTPSGVVTKTIGVGGGLRRLSPVRPARGIASEFLHPAEAALPDGAVHAITVAYPARDFRALGWTFHWMLPFFGLSLLFAWALRRPFGVVL